MPGTLYMEALFWILLFLVFYTYVGYGLFLLLYNTLFKHRVVLQEGQLPGVTVVVPAYNEEDIIRQKIENTLALVYPANKLFFVFVTDGSTDSTPAIVKEFPIIHCLHQNSRGGKSAAINRAMQTVQTEVVIFSDANTLVHPQSIAKMVRHYGMADVGGVSGEKRIAAQGTSTVGFGERLYWQYESLLKKAAGDFYTIVGAAGELFSIRSRCFRPLPESAILDDFVLSASVCLQGFRFLYEAEAYGTETASSTVKEERKRKVRISAGCYQSLVSLPGLLNPANGWRLVFQYVSHRVLRWVICPLALPLLLVSSAVLYAKHASPVYTFLFWAQVVFYLFAVAGSLVAGRTLRLRFLLLPYYFVFMVLSQYAGFYRFVTGRQ